jgi:hypothetical protein
MSAPQRSSITLRALDGTPLEDGRVCSIVVSTAHAIGERTGVEVVSVNASNDRVEVVLVCSRLEAIGFVAELRRLTEQWYARKFPDAGHLWGPPPENRPRNEDTWRSEHEDDDDWWRGGERDLGPPG